MNGKNRKVLCIMFYYRLDIELNINNYDERMLRRQDTFLRKIIENNLAHGHEKL